MSEECPAIRYGTREGPATGAAPYYVPCCKCLQFNQTCNSQYLGVA